MLVCGDVVYAQTWQVLTLKNCIEPLSYASTAYFVAWPQCPFDCFVKIWATCKNFLGKWITAPPGKNCPYAYESKEHAVPFFLKSNCLPLPSLFFRDCSYLLYDINRQTAPVSILNQFFKTSQIHNYRTRSVSSDSFYVKFSRTDKMYAFSRESVPNSIPYSLFD